MAETVNTNQFKFGQQGAQFLVDQLHGKGNVIILGGRPIREPVAWMGPFVMNTRDEVMQAVVDYQAGWLGSIPAVHNAPTTIVETPGAPDPS